MTARLESFLAAVESGAERMVQRALRGLRYRKPAAGARQRPSSVPAASDSAQHELPQTYGRSRVVAMAVDPYHVHVYWEVTDGDVLHATEQLRRAGQAKAPWVLRFCDFTGAKGGNAAHGHFDIPIQLGARSWYVDLWEGNKTYVVELGAGGGSRFVAVCRSPRLYVPPAEPLPAPAMVAWQAVGVPSVDDASGHASIAPSIESRASGSHQASVDEPPVTRPSAPSEFLVPPPPLPTPPSDWPPASGFQWECVVPDLANAAGSQSSPGGAGASAASLPVAAQIFGQSVTHGNEVQPNHPPPSTLRSLRPRSKSVSLADPARTSGGAVAPRPALPESSRGGSRE